MKSLLHSFLKEQCKTFIIFYIGNEESSIYGR
jgi:hypothetical protein